MALIEPKEKKLARMNETYSILKKRFVYMGEVEEAINKSKGAWHEENGFLNTVKGRLTVYLKQLQTQLGKNELWAIENKDYFANVIEKDYKEEKIAKKIKELKFPSHLEVNQKAISKAVEENLY